MDIHQKCPRPRADLDIDAIAALSTEYGTELDRLKARLAKPDFGWYPYDSLALFPLLAAFLRDERRKLLDLAGSDPVLDVGCADGDTSFFLEWLGSKVVAVDWPATNYNQMRGIAELRAALQSTVDIQAINLDAAFTLPSMRFGLAICSGLLYHVKNPYYLMETLAKRCRYCLLTTRVARQTLNGVAIRAEPVAYLLDPKEANADATNYWIFSETGLRRLLGRTGWHVCDYLAAGDTETSDPVHGDRDERAFCLLRNVLLSHRNVSLLYGWHALEAGSWRWTECRFAARIPVSQPLDAIAFEFRFILSEQLLRVTSPVTLEARVNGVTLPPESYWSAGEHSYVRPLPAESLNAAALEVEFALSHAMAPTQVDRRELGIQVLFAGPGETTDDNLPLNVR